MHSGKKGLISLGISCIFIILYVFNSPSFSGAGDMNIAGYLVSDAKPGYYFITPFIAYPLRWLYLHMPHISWWTLFSISSIGICVFICCFCIESIIADKKMRVLMLVIVTAFLWFGVGEEEINFTQTAALYMVSGMTLLWWNGYFAIKKRGITVIAGIVLIMLGWFTRWKAALFCLSFGMGVGGCFLLQFLYRQKVIARYKKADIVRVIKENWAVWVLAGCSAIAVAMLIGYGLADPKWGEYYRANSLRESIYDYYEQYPQYPQNKELYQEIGVNGSMLRMIQANYTADKNYFNSETLKRIRDLKRADQITKESVRNVVRAFVEKPICVFLISVLILGILRMRENILIPVFLLTCLLFVCGGYLAYIGRAMWRVVVGILLAYMMGCIVIAAKGGKRGMKLSKSIQRMAGICIVALCIVTGVTNYSFCIPEVSLKDRGINDCLEYINKHKENIYVMSERKLRYYEAHTVWDSPNIGYCSNLVTYRANFVSGQEEMLKRYGISDLFNALITDKNVLSQYDETVYRYLKDTYHPCVTASVVDIVGNLEIVRYMKPLDISGGVKSQSVKAAVVENSYNLENGRLRLVLSDSEPVQYMNILTAENSYSFAKYSDGDNIIFDIYLPEDVKQDIGGLEVYLLSEKNGSYQFYKDISEVVNHAIGAEGY